MEKFSWLEKRFENTAVSDETFFTMLIMNGPRKQYAVNNNLRYYGRGQENGDPYALTENDIPFIKNGDYLFARKFIPKVSDSFYYCYTKK